MLASLGTYPVTEKDPAPSFGLAAITPNSTTSLTDRQATIHLDPAETVTCTYINTQQVTLSLITAGSGDGTIIVEPTASGRRGLMAGSTGVENSEGSARVYGWDTVLTVTAHPGVNSYFIDWSGDCTGTDPVTELTLDGDKTCTANFGYPVGGIAVPMDRLEVLVPWLGLAALGALVALTVVLVRRRRG